MQASASRTWGEPTSLFHLLPRGGAGRLGCKGNCAFFVDGRIAENLPYPILLNYHAINDPRHPDRCHRDLVHSIPMGTFLRHLAIMQEEGVELVPLRSALSALTNDRPSVSLTFDDGHLADQCTTWPLLQESGVRAAFFICLMNIGGERDPRWAKLRRMHSEGHAIGAHGMGHVPFDRLSEEQQREEMQRSKCVIEDRIGASVDLFAFPSGRVTRFALNIALGIGFASVFTTLGPREITVAHPNLVHRWSIKANTSDARLRSTVRRDPEARLRERVSSPLRKWWFGIPMSA